VFHWLFCKRQDDIRILPMYAATVSHLLWLWPAKFAIAVLEGTVASEVVIHCISHIPVYINHMEYGPGI
jgi:hypothetical protein